MKRPKLINKNQCTGCGSCASACKHNAIKMDYDHNGYLMPFINPQKCIGCHLCESKCPIINLSKLSFHGTKDLHNFSAWSKNDDLCKQASSGGIFSQLAINILRKGNAVVYGAHLTHKNTVSHIGITDEKDLYLIIGTKYIQSNASSAYKECQINLQNGKNVLFCGTPCQIAGLYATLNYKVHPNLLTAELICHGVGSQVAAEVATSYYGADYIVSNRNKNDGWTSTQKRGLSQKSIYSKDGILIETESGKDIFYPCFNNTHRISCTTCHFAKINRIADISLGDQWGLCKSFPQREKLGVSLVLTNTTQGIEAIHSEDISIIENPNYTLNAYPLFYPSVSRWTTLASFLWLLRKMPTKFTVSFITLNWKKNPLVIPFKVIWHFVGKRQLKKIKKAIYTTQKEKGWI